MVTPAVHVKKFGLTGLKQMSEISGKSTSTLRDWFNFERPVFDNALRGCAALIADPYGKWLPVPTVVASKYRGAAVVSTKNNKEHAVVVTAAGFFHCCSGNQIDPDGIAAVMPYRGA